MKDLEIIKLCKKGDQRGYKALVDSYASKLLGVCIRYMKDESSAKDVLQEGFIRIFENMRKYKHTGSLEAWLTRIMVNSALMELRKSRKLPLKMELKQHAGMSLKEESHVEIKLNEEDILDMIYELPDHYRVIFNLYVIEGYTHAEIAKMLQIGESTSRTKLTRARQKMKEIYWERTTVSSDRKNSVAKEIFKIS